MVRVLNYIHYSCDISPCLGITIKCSVSVVKVDHNLNNSADDLTVFLIMFTLLKQT